MNTKEIIEKYLRDNGFDGLYNEDDCACSLDDLVTCGDILIDCEAGHRVPCDCGRSHNFHIAAGLGGGRRCQ